MLISKKSRRASDRFESRFKGGAEGVDFPVRRYMRCREDLASSAVHAALMLAFLVTIVLFGRTLDRLFDNHGADLSPWARRGVFVLWGVFCLSVARRLYYKVLALREIRREMGELRARFTHRGD
jgi:hypothetical protein